MRYCMLIIVIVNGLLTNAGFTEDKKNKTFLSVYGGLFRTNKKDYNHSYESNFGLNLGAGIGFPMNETIYPVLKVNYFQLSGEKNGKANLRQWIINPGIIYKILVFDPYTFYLNGGGTFTSINEKEETRAGTGSTTGGGWLGYFIGYGLEWKQPGKTWAAFFEMDYNVSRDKIVLFGFDYGGLNSNLGIRIFFTPPAQKKKQHSY